VSIDNGPLPTYGVSLAAFCREQFTFANRDNLPVLAQAAVAHAQFESIHPFIDGNGRIGRALVNAILRHCRRPPGWWYRWRRRW
jgi:Fic family protein